MRMKAKRPPRTDDVYGHLMKYGPDANHLERVHLLRILGYQHEAIFLTGIPDIRQSLPHASAVR